MFRVILLERLQVTDIRLLERGFGVGRGGPIPDFGKAITFASLQDVRKCMWPTPT
jgi:hypothetical protein